jgi:hypothetical protein
MKTTKIFFVLIAFMWLLFISCSDNSLSPVSPTDQAKVGSTVTSVDKKGPLVHSVEGSGLLTSFEGKNLGARYTAHEYADGTFDGEYEINCANATGDPTYRINGRVLSFKVYENAGQYGGKIAVFLGQEKTEVYAGFYDVFFAIDNGKPGQTSTPDQVNWFLMELPSEDFQIPAEWGTPWTGLTILDFYNMSFDELIDNFGTADCDKGNITIK